MAKRTATGAFKFDENGLIPVIIQDSKTGQVLMLAYMSHAALMKTLSAGKVHFFSRSRKKMWLKGETSGHIQSVDEILTDCDRDTLLVKVHQKGGACHLGYKTCFVNKVDKRGMLGQVTQKKVFDPSKVYRE